MNVENGCFASNFSPLKQMTFERANLPLKSPLFETPFQLDRVSFSTQDSEIAEPRVRKLRVLIDCHPAKPPSRPPKLAHADLSIVLCPPIHSHTRRGGCLGILGGGFWGAGRGVAIYEKPGFPVPWKRPKGTRQKGTGREVKF